MIALLRRNRRFRLLWIGETTSELGDSVTTVLLPLIALTALHSSALTASLLKAAAWLPWLLLGLPAGAWIDRISRRRGLMIVCDLIAAALFASVPLAALLGVLTITQLLCVALLAGGVSVLFDTTYRVFLLDVVTDPGQRATGNGALQGSASAANVGGPGLAGLLVGLVGGAAALVADCGSFLVSAACLARIGGSARDGAAADPEPGVAGAPERDADCCPERGARAPLRVQIADGLHYLAGEPLLRSLTLFGALSNLALVGYQSILVAFLLRRTHLSASEVGLVLALGGLGGVGGAALARPLSARLGSGRAILVTKAFGGAGALLIPLASAPSLAGLAVCGLVVVGAGIVAGNVLTTTFVQGFVAPEVFARTSATTSVVNYGTIPVGAVLGGVLAAAFGLGAAMWTTAATVPLAALVLLCGPLRRTRELPQPTG